VKFETQKIVYVEIREPKDFSFFYEFGCVIVVELCDLLIFV